MEVVTTIEVKTTNKLYLSVHSEEFDISFAWTRKRGVENDHWFTASGKCKIACSGLHVETVGKVNPILYKKLVKQLKENNTELFKWGSSYYCVINGDSIAVVRNMGTILYQANKEWEERKYIEYWVEDNGVLN